MAPELVTNKLLYASLPPALRLPNCRYPHSRAMQLKFHLLQHECAGCGCVSRTPLSHAVATICELGADYKCPNSTRLNSVFVHFFILLGFFRFRVKIPIVAYI